MAMDQTASRAQNRPYYNHDTFNIGYSSVFKPDKGIVDENDTPLTSRLSIMAGQNGKFLSGSGDKSVSGVLLGSLKPGLGGNNNNNNSSRLASMASSGNKGLLNWDKISDWKYWEKFLWNIVLKNLCKQFFLQPFENSKILMQVATLQETGAGINETESKEQSGNDNTHRFSNSYTTAPVNSSNDNVDFFPIYTRSPLNNVQDTEIDLSKLQKDEGSGHRYKNDNILQFKRLDTFSIMNTIKDDENHSTSILWKSFTISSFYKIAWKVLNYSFLNLLTPMAQFYYRMNSVVHFSSVKTIFIIRTLANLFADLALLPIDLYRVKTIITNPPEYDNMEVDSDEEFENNNIIKLYSAQGKMDKDLIRVYSLILLKNIVKNALDNTLDFIIYFGLNLTSLSPQEKIYCILSLNLFTDILKLVAKLPIETLIRRYQVSYMLKSQKNDAQMLSIKEDQLILEPVNVNTGLLGSGLWNGWKIGLVSHVCGITFKMMNKIDDDLELEMF